jgi:alcohol dehydrogenase, propanol-preferring
MVLERPRSPLVDRDLVDPVPGEDQVLVRVEACAVCRTDLHVIDGELPEPKLPLVPGHQVVGEVVAAGAGVEGHVVGDRVGIPWLGWTDGECRYCRSGRENLCVRALFNGYTRDGGYAELATVDERYAFGLPNGPSPAELAPLLCAGLIGYRALRFCGDAERLGLYGFGSSGHIVCQVARHQGRRVFAFTRPGDAEGQSFARSLGAEWAGDSSERPPEELDAAIVFAPVGELVPMALEATARGGMVICAGIHMSDIPGFPYELLREERILRSVANLTRRDGEELLPLAAEIPIATTTTAYPLAAANRALADLRGGRLQGAAVLDVTGDVEARQE